MATGWATPAAILAGSALVGAGLYFGLRSRGVPPSAPAPVESGAFAPAPSPSTPTTVTGASSRPPPSFPGAPTMPGTPVAPPWLSLSPKVTDDVDRDALAALQKQRPNLLARCWTPAVARDAKLEHASYTLNLAFNDQGHEIGSGIVSEASDPPDVSACVARTRAPLDIPARGRRVQAQVPFTLP